MIEEIFKKYLSVEDKQRFKLKYNKYRLKFINRFYSFDAEQLKEKLKELGIQPGDTLMVHSAYSRFSGFRGSPKDIVDALIAAVGENGNLLMVSMPYRSSTADYLKKSPVFDVKKTPSQMGLVSEVFRGRKDVTRSLHPTHPVLAWGSQQQFLTEHHENCQYGCGAGSPFEKLYELNGKVLFYDVSFNTFTFIHYLEHLVKDDLPFNLYSEDPVCTSMIDENGQVTDAKVFVFSEKAVKLRDPSILKHELEKKNLLKKTTIGKTQLMLVESSSVVNCINTFFAVGKTFYRMDS